MFAPKLYSTYKYEYKHLARRDFVLDLSPDDLAAYKINQADNLLFFQIRRLLRAKGTDPELCGTYVAFINCKGSSKDEDGLSDLIMNGFTVNGRHFVLGERSASMTRNSILSFVDESISDDVYEAITMGAEPGATVISKLMAYRGLCLSSCHCLEGYFPKIIVVDDYECVLPSQHIKYVYDRETSFTNDSGETVPWTQKDVTDGYRDIKVTPFDGCGIHHPSITDEVAMRLGADEDDLPTTILWRASYIKGLTAEVDYTTFYAERGITSIRDIWGVEHDVTPDAEPMIILTKSMYKGFKYYAKTKTAADWDYYWEQFRKYGHCLGVAKWNFTKETEPVYTRCNYQVLQTLNIPYEDFSHLADTSVEWAERIVDGDPLYTMCFLGLTADKHDALNDYTRAILKNPAMLYERTVRNYLISLLSKYIDEMKCGKIWIKSCFKFLLPDMIALMEHAAGLEVRGCIGDGEFFCLGKDGPLLGDKLITRNPHICDSENVVLRAVNNDTTEKYFSHLVNTCIINSRSLIPQRLNGADFDGDLVLVFDDDRVLAGVDRNAIPVIDVDDKITTTPEEFTAENRLKVILRTMKNLIGEYSNYGTAYRNKCPQTDEQRKKYMTYIDVISVLVGKSIDYAKTGVLYPMPRSISRYGRPLPYFMRYASPYYAKQKLSRSYSNINRLCWDIEHWDKTLRWNNKHKHFDWHIMIDETIVPPDDLTERLDTVYSRFCKDVREIAQLYKGVSPDSEVVKDAYGKCYEIYRSECKLLCRDQKMLANILVTLCYERHPSWNRKFAWLMAGPGIVANIKQVEYDIPQRDDDGPYEYLGRRYKMVKYNSSRSLGAY